MPLYHVYADDEEAIAAEAALVADVDFWEDPDFGAKGSSLYLDPYRPPRGALPPDVVDWNRISKHEIDGCMEPLTFSHGAAAGDVIQGQLGNCWFISAMSVMATQPAYIARNFVSEDNKDKGIYTLKFYKQGKWRYVHIDDQIACDRKAHPLFAHGKDPNETWVMVMEKAYAKLHGCYEALKTGYIDYGLRDLTGGMCMKLKFKDKSTAIKLRKNVLFDEVKAAVDEGSLAGCSFNTGAAGETEHDRGDGILAGHAYGILQLKVVEEGGDTFKMVQCRNPWGMREWNGDWCDNDVMWEDYPDIKEQLNPGEFVNDGTFWICWDDFKQQYNQIFICYDFPSSWSSTLFEGTWVPGESCGGCPKFPTFATNPQFLFKVPDKTTAIVSCTREDHRWTKRSAPYTTAVGFVIMGTNGAKVTKFNPKAMKAMSRTFAKSRTVGGDAVLPAGTYAIIPCLFKAQKSGADIDFVLEVHLSREDAVFSEKGKAMLDIDEGLEDRLPGEMPPDTLEPAEADDAHAGAGEGGDDEEGGGAENLFDEPEDEEPEPEEEGRGLKMLHAMVGELAVEMRELTTEMSELQARLEALEG